MTDNNDDFPKFFYIKRHDLRPEEFSSNPCLGEYREWEWWLDPSEIVPFSEVIAEGRLDKGLFNRALYYVVSNDLPDEKLNQENDPAQNIQYFCFCHEWGVYPPPWMMNDLYKRFSKYIADKIDGKDKRLGEYFGESGEGSRKNYFKEQKNLNISIPVMIDIERFRIWFGLSIKDSTAIAAQCPTLEEKVMQFSTLLKNTIKRGLKNTHLKRKKRHTRKTRQAEKIKSI